MSMAHDNTNKTYTIPKIDAKYTELKIILSNGEDYRIEKEVKQFEQEHRIYELIKLNDTINEHIHILLENQRRLIENITASIDYFSEEINEWELDK